MQRIGWLASGPNPLGVLRRMVDLVFVGRLTSGLRATPMGVVKNGVPNAILQP